LQNEIGRKSGGEGKMEPPRPLRREEKRKGKGGRKTHVPNAP